MRKANKTSPPSKTGLFFALVLMILFVFLLIKSKREANNYVELRINAKVDPIEIHSDNNYGSFRGAVSYKKDHFISTSAELIKNPCREIEWTTTGPIIDFDTIPNEYTLADLPLPYIVSKNANSPYLFVTKNNCEFVFKMANSK
jgi:hypothetical protein